MGKQEKKRGGRGENPPPPSGENEGEKREKKGKPEHFPWGPLLTAGPLKQAHVRHQGKQESLHFPKYSGAGQPSGTYQQQQPPMDRLINLKEGRKLAGRGCGNSIVSAWLAPVLTGHERAPIFVVRPLHLSQSSRISPDQCTVLPTLGYPGARFAYQWHRSWRAPNLSVPSCAQQDGEAMIPDMTALYPAAIHGRHPPPPPGGGHIRELSSPNAQCDKGPVSRAGQEGCLWLIPYLHGISVAPAQRSSLATESPPIRVSRDTTRVQRASDVTTSCHNCEKCHHQISPSCCTLAQNSGPVTG